MTAASGDCMVHKVAPLIAHHSSGITSSSQRVRSAARAERRASPLPSDRARCRRSRPAPRPSDERADQRPNAASAKRKMPSPAWPAASAPAEARAGRARARSRSGARLDREAHGEISGRPVDRVIADQQIGPGDPQPAGREDGGDDTSLPCSAAQQQCPEWRGRARAPEYAPARPRDCRARTAGNRCAGKQQKVLRASRSTIPTSEFLDMGDHARTHGLVRQAARGGAHVLLAHDRRGWSPGWRR